MANHISRENLQRLGISPTTTSVTLTSSGVEYTVAIPASVKQVGLHNFSICLDGIDPMLTVDKKHLCQTMLDLYAMKGMIVEPAGALSVAGLELIQDQIKNKVVVCIISGGNFDPKRFPEITKIAHPN